MTDQSSHHPVLQTIKLNQHQHNQGLKLSQVETCIRAVSIKCLETKTKVNNLANNTENQTAKLEENTCNCSEVHEVIIGFDFSSICLRIKSQSVVKQTQTENYSIFLEYGNQVHQTKNPGFLIKSQGDFLMSLFWGSSFALLSCL